MVGNRVHGAWNSRVLVPGAGAVRDEATKAFQTVSPLFPPQGRPFRFSRGNGLWDCGLDSGYEQCSRVAEEMKNHRGIFRLRWQCGAGFRIATYFCRECVFAAAELGNGDPKRNTAYLQEGGAAQTGEVWGLCC